MEDAIKHFVISLAGTILLALLFSLGIDHVHATLYGGGAMLATGLMKEGIWDYLLKKGVPSLADITADAIGVGVGMMINIVIFLPW